VKNQYLVSKNAFFQDVMFEGNRAQVYGWLVGKRVLDAPGYVVTDRLTSTIWEEGSFIREVEEEISKAAEHKCLSEDRIRTIVREEMSKLIDAVREKASVPEYYDAEKMEDAVIAIVEHVSEEKAEEKVQDHERVIHEAGE
jgi:hypothetical protein